MYTDTEWVVARLTKSRAELLLQKLRQQITRPVKNKTQERLRAEWVEQIKALEEALGIEHWPQTIHFNTGRMYGSNGQQITATAHEYTDPNLGRLVTFHDHNRMIDGEFFYRFGKFTPALVMRKYDGSTANEGGGYTPHYSQTSRSRADAFHKGGCNSEYDEAAEVKLNL